MSLPKMKFREIVFQLLFSEEFSAFEEEGIPFMMRLLFVTKKGVREAWEHTLKIREKIAELDALISQYSREYSVDRISKAELTILRLSLFELLYDASVPPKVAISEAVRLTRKYATRDSAKYVNAILDAILNEKLNNSLSENPILESRSV